MSNCFANIISYWQAADYYLNLFKRHNYIDEVVNISSDEYIKGKVNLKVARNCAKVIICPFRFNINVNPELNQEQDLILISCYLGQDGKLSPDPVNPYPLVNQYLLQNSVDLNAAYAISGQLEPTAVWKDIVDYTKSLIENLYLSGIYIDNLIQIYFPKIQLPNKIIPDSSDIDFYKPINDEDEYYIDDEVTQVVDELDGSDESESSSLFDTFFWHQTNSLIQSSFNCNQLKVLGNLLNNSSVKYHTIIAPSSSGKTSILRNFLAEKYLQAIINSTALPTAVWLNKKFIKQVMSCDLSLDEFDNKLFLNKFPNLTAAEISDKLLCQILGLQNKYQQAVELTLAYNNITTQMSSSYQYQGGVATLILQFKDKVIKIEQELSHAKNMLGLWNSRQEKIYDALSWGRYFSFLPSINNYLCTAAENFLRENFPKEVVKPILPSQVSAFIKQIIQRIESKLQAVLDKLELMQQSLEQLKIVENRYQTMLTEFSFASSLSPKEFLYELDISIKHRLWGMCRDYHHAMRLQGKVKALDALDYLFIEHAEDVNIIDILPLLIRAKQVIILGDNNFTYRQQKIASDIDYHIAKYYQVIEYEEDFENLAYQGLTITSSNVLQLGLAMSVPMHLTEVYAKTKSICNLQNKFLDNMLQINHSVTNNIPYQGINIITVPGTSELYAASKINLAEIVAIEQWLKENQTILSAYYNQDIEDIIAICTPFIAQMNMLQYRFTNLTCVSQFEYLPKSFAIILFSSVYGIDDPRPYIFDQGKEYISKLCAVSNQAIYIFAGEHVFNSKQALNSPSSKLALAATI